MDTLLQCYFVLHHKALTDLASPDIERIPPNAGTKPQCRSLDKKPPSSPTKYPIRLKSTWGIGRYRKFRLCSRLAVIPSQKSACSIASICSSRLEWHERIVTNLKCLFQVSSNLMIFRIYYYLFFCVARFHFGQGFLYVRFWNVFTCSLFLQFATASNSQAARNELTGKTLSLVAMVAIYRRRSAPRLRYGN